MPQSYRFSSFLLTLLIFLVPLFFIPGGYLALDTAKSALITLGVVVLCLVFLRETWQKGTLELPRHILLWSAIALPVVYFLSAMLATPSSLSLLGYNLEVGTFGFMLLGVVALLIASVIFSNAARALQAFMALLASLTLLILFVILQIATGGKLSLGIFSGNMGNPLGGWTDLSMAFALLALLCVLTIGMIPMKRSIKTILYVVFAFSLALVALLAYSTALAVAFIGAIFLYFYFKKVESHFLFAGAAKGDGGSRGSEEGERFWARPTLLPITLALVALIFLINPTITGGRKLGAIVSEVTKVQNADVRPTLSTTLSISKAVLSQVALLGSGPNTFAHDWLVFRPVAVNATPFWGIAFPFGVGFIPTQVASTGMLGSAVWLVFLLSLLMLGTKAVSHAPESRSMRLALMSAFITVFSLWGAAFAYAPSSAMLLTAFIFAGVFVGLSLEAGLISKAVLSLKDTSSNRFISLTLIAACVVGALSLGWTGATRTIASYHYGRAVTLSNMEGADIRSVEDELNKAAKFSPVDVHLMALSRLNFAKAQAIARTASGTPEVNRQDFEEALSKSIQAARAAVSANPAGFGNWVALGQIYTALVPEPLKIEGAYENAQYAYGEALKRNPNNPEIYLFLAQLEMAKQDTDKARIYIRNGIALKEDYADAYLLLAQLEVAAKNLPAAISSAEVLVKLVPDNANLYFELGALKYNNEDYEGAVEALEKALELAPNYGNAKYFLGLALQRLGRIDEARAELQSLLEGNPDNVELKAALDSLDGKK